MFDADGSLTRTSWVSATADGCTRRGAVQDSQPGGPLGGGNLPPPLRYYAEGVHRLSRLELTRLDGHLSVG